MSKPTLDYSQLTDEWAESLNNTYIVGVNLITDDEGNIIPSIEAPQVRAVELLVSLTERRALLAQSRQQRTDDDAISNKLKRDLKTAKKELKILKKERDQLKRQLELLKDNLPVGGTGVAYG